MTFAAASVLSTSSMTYNSKTNTLTCEASDISLTPGRLYDDACDYGVWVKSHKTKSVRLSWSHSGQGW